MIGLIFFVPLFFAWWIILGFAEANDTKNKLTRYIGIDAVRGVKRYNVEDYYG